MPEGRKPLLSFDIVTLDGFPFPGNEQGEPLMTTVVPTGGMVTGKHGTLKAYLAKASEAASVAGAA